MKTLVYFDGQSELDLEVVNMEKSDIPESEFQVPDGYSRVTLEEFFHLESQEGMHIPSGEEMQKMLEEMGLDPEDLFDFFQQN
ncbi:MAG: hypothetical protein U5L00_21345 [Desulfovermiculus sp.]|nr:hypothetical protein [Desulfovermiculus sp.]